MFKSCLPIYRSNWSGPYGHQSLFYQRKMLEIGTKIHKTSYFKSSLFIFSFKISWRTLIALGFENSLRQTFLRSNSQHSSYHSTKAKFSELKMFKIGEFQLKDGKMTSGATQRAGKNFPTQIQFVLMYKAFISRALHFEVWNGQLSTKWFSKTLLWSVCQLFVQKYGVQMQKMFYWVQRVQLQTKNIVRMIRVTLLRRLTVTL